MRTEVMNVPIDVTSMDAAVARAGTALDTREPCVVLAVNPEKVMAARHDSQLLAALRSAHLLIPDGIGVVLALRWQGHRARRVPGSELMPRLCALAQRRGARVFLFGATDEVNRLAAARLLERHPGLNIAGRAHGYVDATQTPALVERICRCRTDMLFVALGSPRQERWIAANQSALAGVPVIQAVGGTFDVIAGRVRRAPGVWIRLNLEWLYRLLSDPRRLVRQRALPGFALGILRERLDRIVGAVSRSG